MDKIKFVTDEGETVEFYVEEQTRVNGTDYLLVTDSMDDEANAYILKDSSEETDPEADYVMVEDLHSKAAAGLDIGGTLIGMHLRPVVVPIHAATRRIGAANLVMARTRPKYVGGPRALYDDIPRH